jgi:CheY-like chemotaxis protein
MKTTRILYFDDENWNSEPLIKNIEDSYPEYQIKYVENVENFLYEISTGTKYDLIIIDIMAPMVLILDNENVRSQFTDNQIEFMKEGLSAGEVFYEKIRRTKDYESIPILFYSAKRASSISDPNTSFLRKPELVEDIHQKIQLMINK